eukprot:TRINITY_DN1266_c0_g1_i1.p1 TRINITY_DN1266_c0_g1~~TRINITY_DN1266_c0_g1_i1.p1  ORF type:complete len:441 (-),score=5.91 TRINITY_DN1266_c0_g1_i1:59-1381(-)
MIDISQADLTIHLSITCFIVFLKIVIFNIYILCLRVKTKQPVVEEDKSYFPTNETTPLFSYPQSDARTPVKLTVDFHQENIEQTLIFAISLWNFSNNVDLHIAEAFISTCWLLSRLSAIIMYANSFDTLKRLFSVIGSALLIILNMWTSISLSLATDTSSLLNISKLTFSWAYTILTFKIAVVSMMLNNRLKVEKEERYTNIVRNDLENILPYFFVASMWQRQLEGFNDVTLIGGSALVAIFAVSRTFHTIAYAFELQPWRFICFLVGLLGSFAHLIWLIVVVSMSDYITGSFGAGIYSYSLTSLLLYAMAFLTAFKRRKTGLSVSPEDKKFGNKQTHGDPSEVIRVLECHRNLLEYFAPSVLFLHIIFPPGSLVSYDQVGDIVNWSMFFIIFGFQVIYSNLFLKAVQPHRFLASVLIYLAQFAFFGWIVVNKILESFGL